MELVPPVGGMKAVRQRHKPCSLGDKYAIPTLKSPDLSLSLWGEAGTEDYVRRT